MLFLELLIAILLGISAGIVTGLIPGIHINLVSILLLSVSAYFLNITSPLVLACFVIAMSITHTFLDSIPSIFLGAPDPDMALSVLPGHKLLLEGKGYEAVKLTVIGSLLCLILTILIIPFMIPFVPQLYSFIQPYMGHILIFVVAYMILKESGLNKKVLGLLVFVVSGILGLIVLNTPNLSQPLLAMLSGLFGVSTLVTSLNDNVEVPKQTITDSIKIPKLNTIKALGAAVFSGSLTGMMPGLGAAQAAVLGMQIVGNVGPYAFMILIGGINTVNFLFSLVTLYTLQKARNGAVVAVLEIVKSIDLTDLIVLISCAAIAGGIATFLAMFITKGFSNIISKINYKIVCISIILLISILVLIFNGPLGILILITSTALGIIPPQLGIKRSLSMGCLLLPVILFFML